MLVLQVSEGIDFSDDNARVVVSLLLLIIDCFTILSGRDLIYRVAMIYFVMIESRFAFRLSR